MTHRLYFSPPEVIQTQGFKHHLEDFAGGPVVKNSLANAGDVSSIPVQEDPTCHGATKPVDHS